MKKRKAVIILIAVLAIMGAIGVYFSYQKIEQIDTEKNVMNNEIDYVETEALENTNESELPDGILGVLEIDKINVKGLVKEGSTSEVLKNYIGHIESTPKYDGNIGLAAHNRGNIYSYFSKINQLKQGDEIKYKTMFGENYYSVDKISEIDETDWSMLEDTEENKLTLITCIKNVRSKRLCVQATKIKKDL